MSGAVKVLPCALLLLLSTACYPEPMELGVSFPTEQSFYYSDYAELYMFNISEGERGDSCPELMIGLLNGTAEQSPRESSGAIDVCDLRSGGFRFEDIGEGTRAFVVIVHAVDAGASPLLFGCVTADTYVDSEDVVIELTPVEGSAEVMEDIGELDCASIDDKCRGGC